MTESETVKQPVVVFQRIDLRIGMSFEENPFPRLVDDVLKQPIALHELSSSIDRKEKRVVRTLRTLLIDESIEIRCIKVHVQISKVLKPGEFAGLNGSFPRVTHPLDAD